MEKIVLLVQLILILIFQSCRPENKASSTSVAVTSSSDDLVTRWSSNTLSSGPISLKVSNTFNTDFSGIKTSIEQMADNWDSNITQVNILNDSFTEVSNLDHASRADYFNDNEMGIYKSTNWFSDVSAGAIAITQFTSIERNSGTADAFNDMNEADIIVNFRDFTFRSTADAGNGSNYDLVTVIHHELGHLLGIQHLSEASSVMAASLAQGDFKRTLSAPDTNAIIDLYRDYSTVALEATSTLALNAEGNGRFAGRRGPSSASKGPHAHPKLKYGIIELLSDGTCREYSNGKLIKVTKHPNLFKKRKRQKK